MYGIDNALHFTIKAICIPSVKLEGKSLTKCIALIFTIRHTHYIDFHDESKRITFDDGGRRRNRGRPELKL